MIGESFGHLFESLEAGRPVRIRVSDETFGILRDELEDFDVRRIAAGAGGSISVWFDNDGDGQMSWVELPAGDAMEFYEAGFQIYIRDIDSPTLSNWRREFHEKSGLGDHFGCALFATRNPHVAACHFDPVENITLQLTGSKLWRLASNRSVHLPTADLSEVGMYAAAPFPEALPEDSTEYALEPGHVLYIPRGYWHEVVGASEDPTLSLTFHYPALTWADLIAPALRTLLLRKERWRMSARCLGGDGSEPDASHFRKMIEEAAAELRALDPCFLFPRANSPRQETAIRRNPLATLSIYPGGNANELALLATVHIGEHSRSYEAAVPAQWRDFLEQVLGEDTLSVEDVHRVAGPAGNAILDVLHSLDVVTTVG